MAIKKAAPKKNAAAKKNAVPKKEAVPKSAAPKNAAPKRKAAPPLREKERPTASRFALRPLLHLSSRAYEHPADHAARLALRKVPGFDLAVRKIFGALSDRALRLLFLGSAVRVSPRQFPGVYDRYREACRVLDIRPMPELYVAQTPFVNAGAIGVETPFIVLQSGTLDLLDEDELRFLLGHELGHVLSGHALYKTMLRLLIKLSVFAFSIPLGGAALFAVRAALLEWDRKGELSADRAGLLAVQDPEVALSVQMKLAGGGRTKEMDVDDFLRQAEEYESGGSVVDSVVKLLQLTGTSHPFPVLRAAELRRWVESGDYQKIVDGDYPRREDDNEPSLVDELKRTAETYAKGFTDSDDPLSRMVTDAARDLSAAGTRLRDRWRRRRG